MKNRVLLRTNLLICIVILIGSLFCVATMTWDHYQTSMRDIERISFLTSEDFYYQISDTFSRPVNTSLAIANDVLMRDFLVRNKNVLDNPANIEILDKYLENYQQIYQYDTAFFVSATLEHLYNTSNRGEWQPIRIESPASKWYYDAVSLPNKYTLDINNDFVNGVGDILTMFVNCKIYDDSNQLLGLIGVGVRIDDLQRLVNSYKDRLGVNAYFVDREGVIQLSSNHSGFEKVYFKDVMRYAPDVQQAILDSNNIDEPIVLWTTIDSKMANIVIRDIPEIGWRLIVEEDNADLLNSLTRQLVRNSVIVIVTITIVLCSVTKVIHRFNKKIVSLEQAYEQERKTAFAKATQQFFDDIYVIDITHDRPVDRDSEDYFARLGIPAGMSFSEYHRIIADRYVQEEYRQGFIDTFSPNHVLDAFAQGQNTLKYEFLMTKNGVDYYWIRVTACLIVANLEDSPLLMYTYQQNIDKEKQREDMLKKRARIDEMTELLHKTATQEAIDEILQGQSQIVQDKLYALFIFDIDHFKSANDTFGHAFGDKVIKKVADTIRANFRGSDLLGRIGGDEFAVFLKAPDIKWAKERAMQLNKAMSQDFIDGDMCWHLSISIGIAFAPINGRTFKELYTSADSALYKTKRGGRDGFSLA